MQTIEQLEAQERDLSRLLATAAGGEAVGQQLVAVRKKLIAARAEAQPTIPERPALPTLDEIRAILEQPIKGRVRWRDQLDEAERAKLDVALLASLAAYGQGWRACLVRGAAGLLDDAPVIGLEIPKYADPTGHTEAEQIEGIRRAFPPPAALVLLDWRQGPVAELSSRRTAAKIKVQARAGGIAKMLQAVGDGAAASLRAAAKFQPGTIERALLVALAEAHAEHKAGVAAALDDEIEVEAKRLTGMVR